MHESNLSHEMNISLNMDPIQYLKVWRGNMTNMY